MSFKSLSLVACLAVSACLLAGCGGTGGVEPVSANSVAPGGASGGLQGTPPSSVVVGQTYSFQPSGSAGLTFTATNLPGWLTLDASTGRLTGTPAEADIGMYSGVTLRASSGASLGPFSITVAAQGAGTARVSWVAPIENTNGSALTDLAGFAVLYGPSPNELTQTIEIDNPSITTYIVESLGVGTWYFAVQAINTTGVRSELSEMGSKTIE